MSLQSNTLSTASGCSLSKGSRNLREKVHEIETYRDILSDSIMTLQLYFDNVSLNGQVNLETEQGLSAVDFKGEAITFRETSNGVLTTLNHCLEIIMQKEDGVKKKLDKEIEKRKRLEDELK